MFISFLGVGEIPIDNNRAENAVRPFCGAEKLAFFSIGKRCPSQCDDVFGGSNSLCERDKCGAVSYGFVPMRGRNRSAALVK